jgi:NADPH2:quinone reductase
MKAIQVTEFGGPEVLKLNELPTPKPEPGQVLVKVGAAGVNPYDTFMRAGIYYIKPQLPFTPGSDGAGTVVAVGPGVESVKPGDRVYTARTITGAYAEYTLTLEAQAQRLPSNLSFEQGAGVWVPYGTAYHAIHHEANVRSSDTVLVHGASGGVGSASVQMLRAMGCTVFGTASSQVGLDLVKREGATQVFNHGKAGYTDEIMEDDVTRSQTFQVGV